MFKEFRNHPLVGRAIGAPVFTLPADIIDSLPSGLRDQLARKAQESFNKMMAATASLDCAVFDEDGEKARMRMRLELAKAR